MALRNYVNTSKEGQLSLPIGTGDTTITLTAPGLVNIPATPFYVRLDPDTGTEELILVGAGSSATSLMNCTRGFDGTSAYSHTAGAKARHCVAAEFYNKSDAHVEATSNVHGLSGGAAVVGTTQVQTLTGKTINASVIDVAHTTSPAASQGVKVSADNATSRDGFVWDNTGGSAGRSVVVRAGGVDRFIVTGVGLVVSNSATGTDKALSVQNSAVERFFLQNDGHADFGLQAAAVTVDRVRIRTQSTQNALAIKDSGGFNIFTIGGGGNVDASGYIATAANLSATGNLSVTGTSALTGDVTLPLPAAGTTTRLIVSSRTGGTNFEAKNQAGATTFAVAASGQTSVAEKVYVHNALSPAIASVSGTGVVPSPSAGVTVFDESDGYIKRYNGASWVIVASYGYVANGHARYQRTTNQSLPSGVLTKIAFPTAVTSHADVSVNGSNNQFTLNKSGLWMIESSLYFVSVAASTSRSMQIADATPTTRYGGSSTVNEAGGDALVAASAVRRFTSGDVVSIYGYQQDAGSLDVTGTPGELTHVSFTWLRA